MPDVPDPDDLDAAAFYLRSLKNSFGGKPHRNIDTALAGLAELAQARERIAELERDLAEAREWIDDMQNSGYERNFYD